MTRLMALDVGEARIGVAISDAMRLLASPYTTVHVTRDEAKTWETIRQLLAEMEAEALVVGLPISLDGQLHAQGERVQAFVKRLKQHIDIPITFWDERLSTVEAQRLLAERGQEDRFDQRRGGRSGYSGRPGTKSKRRHKGQEIDALAAAVILQEYLDSLGKRTEDIRL